MYNSSSEYVFCKNDVAFLKIFDVSLVDEPFMILNKSNTASKIELNQYITTNYTGSLLNLTILPLDGLSVTNDMVAVFPTNNKNNSILISRYSIAEEFSLDELKNMTLGTFL